MYYSAAFFIDAAASFHHSERADLGGELRPDMAMARGIVMMACDVDARLSPL